LVLESLDSVDSTAKWLQSHSAPDLIFMDIQLADGISFEIFQLIDITTPVIFCTAYDEYAIDAFKANSIDYLLKPLERQAVCASLLKFKKLRNHWVQQVVNFDFLLNKIPKLDNEHCSRLLVKIGRSYISISCEDIEYIYIEYKIVNLVTLVGKSYTLDRTMDELESLLDSSVFFRVNRQVIISIKGIRKVESDDGRLKVKLISLPQKSIVVSRDKATSFKSWLGY